MRPKGHKQSRGQRHAISQGMQAYHARVREALADYLSLKESIRSKGSAPVNSKGSAPVKKSPRSTITLGAAAIVLVVAGVVAAALLIAPREPSRADIATIETPTTVPAAGDPATARQARMSAAIAPEEAATRNVQASRTAPEESATRKVQASRTSSIGAVPATRLAADTTPAAAPQLLTRPGSLLDIKI